MGSHAENAILLSSRALRSVTYECIKEDKILDLSVADEDDPWKIALRVKFAQSVEWDNSPIFEILTPPPGDAQDQ